MIKVITITCNSYNNADTSALHVLPKRASSGDLRVLRKVDANARKVKT